MSTAASTAVLIISAISTNAIESSNTINSILETSTTRAATRTATAIEEMDPHVPLRAEHVDDSLERDVEALEDRGRTPPGNRAHRRRLQDLLLAALHRVAVVEAEQVENAVDERPTPFVTDDLRAEDDVAQRPRHAVGQLVEAVDRERQDVGGLVDAEMLCLEGTDLRRRSRRRSRAPLRRPPAPSSTRFGPGRPRAAASTIRPLRFSTSTSITSCGRCRSLRRAACTPRRSAGRACAGRRPRARTRRIRCRRPRAGCPVPGSGPMPARAEGRSG